MGRLTAAAVRAINTPGKCIDEHGLILRVAPGGSKQWVWRDTTHGRRRDLGLGAVAYTTLAEAREIAFEYRKLARAGGDPVGAGNCVVAGQAAFRYSLMSPSQRAVFTT